MKICEGQSTTTDTLCFPVSVIQKVLIAAEQKKVLEEQVSILNQRIGEKETIILSLNSKDSVNKKIVTSFEDEIKVMKDQRGIYDGMIKAYEKQIKKLKRSLFWTRVGGIAVIAAGTYLYITK